MCIQNIYIFQYKRTRVKMNRVQISSKPSKQVQSNARTISLSISQAVSMLPALRSDHFVECVVNLDESISQRDLKFFMHLSRIFNSEGKLILSGQNKELGAKLAKTLGFHQISNEQNSITFSKKPIQNQMTQKKQHKLAIGTSKLNSDEIDQDDLLKNQNIDLSKPKFQSCADKPKACANCSCGRKQNQPLPSKQQLVKSINDGRMISGCGKCSMADSFRCGTCPYRGLPSFKPGDRLELNEDGKIIVQEGGIVVNSGKVKLEL